MSEVRMPGPQEHTRATLKLLDRFAGSTATPIPAALRCFVEEARLPTRVPPEHASMKYDLYLAMGERRRWGMAINDRYEDRDAFLTRVDRTVSELDDRGWRAFLATAVSPGASVVLACGMDGPEAPPRWKLYFQEPVWNEGVIDPGRLADRVTVPPWVAGRRIGVVCLELQARRPPRVKLYVGGATPEAAAGGAPGIEGLVDAIRGPVPGWYYVTLRLGDREPRLAMNKIYDHVAIGFRNGGRDLAAAWREVEMLFARAGQSEGFAALRGVANDPTLIVVPTATAVEDAGHSADTYFAGWERPYG